jgi:glyoxylase-like metal-dependent hydrolase (beta-lactamase superfamily II)
MMIETSKGTAVEVINCGNFLLDGGSMFGRVPKVMWEKWFPADGKNRIIMAANVLRIFKDGKVFLVDAGLGSHYGKKDCSILGIDIEQLHPIKEPVDCLICTHLHFDHVGGIQDLEVSSEVLVSRVEWENAHVENPLIHGSYRRIDLDLIAKRLRLIDPPCSIADGIQLLPSPGHTRGHVSVLIDDEILYAGDLIPTSAHVHLPCIMAYDLYPLDIIETKQQILTIAHKRGWKVIYEHDPYRPVSSIRIKNNKFIAL